METLESRVERAVQMFKEGRSCSQAVFMAFSDLYGLPDEYAASVAAPFGVGIARMHETCGTVIALAMLAGMEDSNPAKATKLTRQLIDDFIAKNGSISCKELLGLVPAENIVKKSCAEKVRDASNIFANYLKNKPNVAQNS